LFEFDPESKKRKLFYGSIKSGSSSTNTANGMELKIQRRLSYRQGPPSSTSSDLPSKRSLAGSYDR
jgi:hypothetical protein